ncbi:MAG: transposase [Pseudomonadales bacterium]|nr:transposase [Pseudomonadales bacterium]
MARQRRFCPANFPQHVIQRGNNRQVCFASDSDLAAYANWLWEAAEKYQISIHAWVFMTNHIHLLVTPSIKNSIAPAIQYVGRYYVRYFNQRYQRTGTLFEGRYKAHIVQNNKYLINCQKYIEMNPVRAGMVKKPEEYKWSSYQSSAFGKTSKLWHPHSAYLSLGQNSEERQKCYRELLASPMDEDELENIRHSAQKGIVLGNKEFREQVSALKKVAMDEDATED